MKDKFGLVFVEDLQEMIEITDIAVDVGGFLLQISRLEIVGIAWRIEGITDNLRP
jgi:hypothetical protein